ncbi:MAG: hypothetical protein L6R28_21975 [Planctomycetes bacterium]|nr:hypothetical protein [Planctomycetota bacterium]
MRSWSLVTAAVVAAAVLSLPTPAARAATPESDALKQAKAAIKLRQGEAKADQALTAAGLFDDLDTFQAAIVDGSALAADIPKNLVGNVVPGMVQLYRDSYSVVSLTAQDIFNIYDAANLDVPLALQAGSGGDVDKMRAKLEAGNAKLNKKFAARVKKLADAANKSRSGVFRLNATVLPFPALPPVLATQAAGGFFNNFPAAALILAAGSAGTAASGNASVGGLLDDPASAIVNFGTVNPTVGGTVNHTFQADETGRDPNGFSQLFMTDTTDSILVQIGGIYIPAP